MSRTKNKKQVSLTAMCTKAVLIVMLMVGVIGAVTSIFLMAQQLYKFITN